MRKKSIGPNDLEEIRKALGVVSVYGQHLRAMVKGLAVKTYLKNIAHLLDVDKGQSWTAPVITVMSLLTAVREPTKTMQVRWGF